MFESTLLGDIVGDGPVFWAGARIPSAGVDSSLALFDDRGDFRLPPFRHGQYRTVYLVEYDLSRYKQWPLIMDEALRLFEYGERGTLFVRFSQSRLLSAFAFAAFLRRRSDFTFELEYQDAFRDGTILYCLRCRREPRQPSLSSMEFAVVSDGKRPGAVARFIASVVAIKGIDLIDWSIAVCCPARPEGACVNAAARIRHIETPSAPEHPSWVTCQKNLVVSTSHADNLLIAHDCYALPPGFLAQLFEFGADFGVVVPKQIDSHGEAVPDWVATGSQWTGSGSALLEYGDYSPHCHVHGGVLIAKRHVLVTTTWNELLFQGQCEEVELSRALSVAGITPRLAREVRVHVVADHPGATRHVERLPYMHGHYVLPRLDAERADMPAREYAFDAIVRFDGQASLERMADAGIVGPSSEWTCGASGLVLAGRKASLSIALPAHEGRSVFLAVYIPAYAEAPHLAIDANGTALQLRWTESEAGLRCASARLDDILAGDERSLVLLFSSDTDAVVLKALAVLTQEAGMRQAA